MRLAIVFIVTFAISFPSFCYAESATQRKAVEELFSLMKFIEKMPEIMKESLEIGQRRAKPQA